jgi:DNA-binding XRE family transcriptional regulator
MPRQPSVKHPLRTARVILGLSQAEFGKAVGVSGYSIQQIENGRLAISYPLARKISRIYRLDPEQVFRGEDPDHPRLLNGAAFTKEGSEELRKIPAQRVDDWIKGLGSVVKILGESANEEASFLPFVIDLAITLKVKMLEFRLEDKALSLRTLYGKDPNNSDLCESIDSLLFSSSVLFNPPIARPPKLSGDVGSDKELIDISHKADAATFAGNQAEANRQWNRYEKRKAEISAEQEKVAQQKSRQSTKTVKSAKRTTAQNRSPQASAHRP